MSNYGYTHGNPFGDPEGFTRSTGEDELDRFNRWMRSQPWWAAVQHDPSAVQMHLAQMGIQLPDSFHIDEAGNLNQKSRTGAVLKGLAIGGGAALGGLGLAGLGPLGFLGGGGAAAADAGASAIPAMEGGGTLAANLGSASALPAAFGGAASAAPAVAGALNYIPPGAAAMEGAAGGSGLLGSLLKMAPVGAGLVGKLASGGFGGGNSGPAGQMSPELQQMLQLSLQRMNSQQPLFDAVNKQALAGLPTYAQGGK